MKRILLFASGSGSNVQAILSYFHHNKQYVFPAIITNNKNAGVISIARTYGIDVLLVDKTTFHSDIFLDTINFYQPNLLVLAGFLWKIPSYLVEAFPSKIINIHPALLPKYGGKGMYGHHVHEAVIAAGEKETGMTIHLVNEAYDEGTILLQKKVAIDPKDDAQSIAKKVLALEHEWYSQVIERMVN